MSYKQYVADMGGASKSVSGSSFVTGVMNSVDIAGTLVKAINFNEDLRRANVYKGYIDNLTSQGWLATAQAIAKRGNQSGLQILKDALAGLKENLTFIEQQSYDAITQGASGFSMTASMIGQYLRLYNTQQEIDFNIGLLVELPQSYIARQATKWYNKAMGIEDPADHDFYMLMINGYKTPTQYITKFQEDNGFSIDDATHLALIRNWQYGVPDLKTAWTMVQRGYWSKDDWLELATLGEGWTTQDANALYKTFNYVPSIGDVMSLSTLIPLDPLWVNAAFDRSGMNATDKQIFLNGINKSVILRDIRGAWAQILASYVYGAFTETELNNLLVGWQFPQAEITIKIGTANMLRDKTVAGLMRDADIYLYRKATITACALYDRLIAQNIPPDVANAITRNEACKQGDDWELADCTP